MGMFLHPQGGYEGSEDDVSRTALVLIALHEGKTLCSQEIPVGPKIEGRICRVPYLLHSGLFHSLMSLSVYPSLLTPRPLSSDHLHPASSL